MLGDHHQVAFVTHHAPHGEAARARHVCQVTRLIWPAPAPRQTDVDVDQHLAQAGGGRRVDRLRRVDGDRDPRMVLGSGEGGQASLVEDLVRQEEVVAQAGGSHPEHLAWGGTGERRVSVAPLLEGEGGALVGLDVGPQ